MRIEIVKKISSVCLFLICQTHISFGGILSLFLNFKDITPYKFWKNSIWAINQFPQNQKNYFHCQAEFINKSFYSCIYIANLMNIVE